MKKKKGNLYKQDNIIKMFYYIFLASAITCITEILFKSDFTKNSLLLIVLSAITFLGMQLAKKNSIAAGVIGIIIGFLEFVSGGLLWKIIGILLINNSLIYLINYADAKNKVKIKKIGIIILIIIMSISIVYLITSFYSIKKVSNIIKNSKEEYNEVTNQKEE